MKCRDADVFPKLVLFEYLKNKPYKAESCYYCCILLDEVRTKNRSICSLKQQVTKDESGLHWSTHWLKGLVITYTLSNITEDVKIYDKNLSKS